MQKFLFVNHSSIRTGAPLVLLYFLQWLRKHNSNANITVLTLERGDLTDEFKKVADNYYDLSEIKIPEETFYQNIQKRILKKVGLYRQKHHPKDLLIEDLSKKDFDIIYANSIISLPVALKIKGNSQASLLVHVHELSTIISLRLPNFIDLLSKVDLFIAVSTLVKNELKEKYLIPGNMVKVINAFSKINISGKKQKEKKFIVGGAGTVHWRKGSDIFIQIAYFIKKKAPELDIEFRWIGNITSEEKIILEADLEKLALNDSVFFLGQQDNPSDHFSGFDIFLMPSREDPFPLVAIEGGMLGKPILCFEKATGIAELMDKGGGYVVPYLEVEDMAEKIIFYYKNKEEVEKDGEIAKEIFSEFSPENKCPELFSVLQQLING